MRLGGIRARARSSARAYVQKKAAFGGTNLHAALLAAFKDDEVDTIFLLSDGEPSVGKITDVLELRALVANQNRVAQIRIHTISVGRSSAFLRGLAEDSGGTYLEVGLPQ